MKLVAVTATVLLVAACGGGENPAARPDPEEWRQVVEARVGHPFRSDAAWHAYQALVAGACDDYGDDPDSWRLYIATGIDNGTAAASVVEDVSYACPENVEAVRTQVENQAAISARLQEACAQAPADRTPEQKDLVDAVGC